jgi:hypothetical protein
MDEIKDEVKAGYVAAENMVVLFNTKDGEVPRHAEGW